MAVAIEDLTPEAQAVAARLHPAVKQYLEAKAGKAAAAAAEKAAQRKPKPAPSQEGRASASRSQAGSESDPLGRAAAFERKLDAITPGSGPKGGGGRLISALFIGVLVLEVLSYALGQPFGFKLPPAPGQAADLSNQPYHPLYKGQVLGSSSSAKSSPLSSGGSAGGAFTP